MVATLLYSRTTTQKFEIFELVLGKDTTIMNTQFGKSQIFTISMIVMIGSRFAFKENVIQNVIHKILKHLDREGVEEVLPECCEMHIFK